MATKKTAVKYKDSSSCTSTDYLRFQSEMDYLADISLDFSGWLRTQGRDVCFRKDSIPTLSELHRLVIDHFTELITLGLEDHQENYGRALSLSLS